MLVRDSEQIIHMGECFWKPIPLTYLYLTCISITRAYFYYPNFNWVFIELKITQRQRKGTRTNVIMQ